MRFSHLVVCMYVSMAWSVSGAVEIDKHNTQIPVPKHVYQFGNAGRINERDSIVLDRNLEDDMPYYSRVSVFRNGKLIFSFSDSSMEVDGSIFPFAKEFWYNGASTFVFAVSDRPNPNRYLVLQANGEKYSNLGVTKNVNPVLLGDVDFDNIVELGGCNNFEGCNRKDIFVYKLTKGFPIDTAAQNALRSLSKKK